MLMEKGAQRILISNKLFRDEEKTKKIYRAELDPSNSHY